MNDETKAALTNLDTWKRGLYMVLFAIISGVVKLVVTLVAIFQFITLLFKGRVNETVLPFSQNLSTYLYQVTLFLTFKTDETPFPFIPFPDGTPKSASEEGNEESSPTTEEAAEKSEENIADSADEDAAGVVNAEKDQKDGSSK